MQTKSQLRHLATVMLTWLALMFCAQVSAADTSALHPGNNTLAFESWRNQADGGNPGAQYNLGLLYERLALGVMKSSLSSGDELVRGRRAFELYLMRAYAWYCLAAAQRLTEADHRRRMVLGRLTPAGQDAARVLASEMATGARKVELSG